MLPATLKPPSPPPPPMLCATMPYERTPVVMIRSPRLIASTSPPLPPPAPAPPMLAPTDAPWVAIAPVTLNPPEPPPPPMLCANKPCASAPCVTIVLALRTETRSLLPPSSPAPPRLNFAPSPLPMPAATLNPPSPPPPPTLCARMPYARSPSVVSTPSMPRRCRVGRCRRYRHHRPRRRRWR